MDSSAFRRHGHDLVDWIADYLDHPERYPVLARVQPGDIAAALPDRAPEEGEPFDRVMADFERILVPGLTHWNHPGFLAYFAITGSAPGILGELLAAALNQQAMLWRTSPAATELEAVTLGWLRELIGLPDAFDGVIYDTASVATLHALIAARHLALPDVRREGLSGSGHDVRPRVYCSEQAHSSIDKAVIAVGFGERSLRKVVVDEAFQMRPDALASAIAEDRAAGARPLAVVATVGTTATTSVDPVSAIAAICRREGIWLHVDAAYAGVAAMVPSHAHILHGVEQADSLVVNPHKWLFTPFDLSAFYCRRMDVLRASLSVVPEYLKTPEASASRDLMDTGIQLGRRFRSLKLWMILRSFGARRLREIVAGHIALARQLASWVDADPDFERMAPAPFSVVCFRWNPSSCHLDHEALDLANQRLADLVNATGAFFISHTRLRGRVTLRVAIGHLMTTDVHVRGVWDLLKALARDL